MLSRKCQYGFGWSCDRSDVLVILFSESFQTLPELEGTIMAGKPNNNRKRWTAEDLKEFEENLKHNTPTRLIALHLGRTEAAVRSKAAELKKSLKPTNRPPYGTGGKRRSK